MLTQTQAPVQGKQAYDEVRKIQLKSPQKQPFANAFLLWIYQEYLEEVFNDLPLKYRPKVDALVMLTRYITLSNEGKTLTGLEVETLTDVLAQITHLMDWD